MRLRLGYYILPPYPSALELPIDITAEGMSFTAQASTAETDPGPLVVVEAPIDASTLRLVTPDEPFDRSSRPQLHVPGAGLLREFAQDVVNALTFLNDEHVILGRRFAGDALLVDTESDRARITAFGTDQIASRTSMIASMRTVGQVAPSSSVIAALLRKRTGLLLYAEAVALTRPVARFRELWRVLESAFGCSDADLLDLLAQYPSAVRMGFDRSELRGLLELRGRASHADSRPNVGRATVAQVIRETSDRIGRLKGLVEQVIVTKRTWGTPTVAVDPPLLR